MKATANVIAFPRLNEVDEQAEASVVSLVVSDGAEVVPVIRDLLLPTDFEDERHRLIVAAAYFLADTAQAVEPLNLCARLNTRGQLEAAGGRDYVYQLANALVPVAVARHYAERVLDASKRRSIERVLREKADAAADGRMTADEIVSILRPTFDALDRSRGGESRLLGTQQILDLPPVQYTVAGFVPKNGGVCIYGPPGSTKSVAALDMAMSVATAVQYHGYKVEGPMAAVYVAAEGSAGLGQRLRAWVAEHGFAGGNPPIWFLCEAVNLMDANSVSRFLADTRSAVAGAVGLVVFDTLARCMPGGDENSSKDMGLVIAAVDRVRKETGAAVVLVHHTVKNGDTERGSGALRGGMDTMIHVTREGPEVTLDVDKQKDGTEFKTPLELAERHGSVVHVTANPAWQSGRREMGDNHRKMLLSLSRDFTREGATATEWQTATGVAQRSFFRLRTDLVSWGYVEFPGTKRGARYTITPLGRDAITAKLPLTAKSLPDSDDYSLTAKRPSLRGAAVAVTAGESV